MGLPSRTRTFEVDKGIWDTRPGVPEESLKKKRV